MRRLDPNDAEVPDDPLDKLGASGGVYVLVLKCAGRAFRARVGALGVLGFRRGFYCYVGSARTGLRARLRRHLQRTARATRWHVDYLRGRLRPLAAVTWTGQGAGECRLSQAVAALADGSVAGFGCSDCRCRSHLYYFARDPAARLGKIRLPGTPVPLVVRMRGDK
ncbi:MAG: GIY-YIG nuclease family protein [Candidatus Brocadiae bacterium]|nr:GIY-YIG nuclease family protein [Candidatus Brocadiia bacterium]